MDMSRPQNVEEKSKLEKWSSEHSHFIASTFGESSGVLASTDSHPHLICKSDSGLRQEANNTPGHPHSPIRTPLDSHCAIDPLLRRQLNSTSDKSSTGFIRQPLHSIPETGHSGNAQLIPLPTKSRKRSSSSDIDCAIQDAHSLNQVEGRGEKLRSGPNKRGRRPLKLDMKSKLEKSRQSARECRARKKLRYQYLEELVSAREKAIFALREELEMYKSWCKDMDEGKIPPDMKSKMEKLEKKLVMPGDERRSSETMDDDADDDDDVDSEDDDDSDEFEDDDEDEETSEKHGGAGGSN